MEIAKYLGVGYRELAESPQWFLELAGIRLREENEYHAYLAKKQNPRI